MGTHSPSPTHSFLPPSPEERGKGLDPPSYLITAHLPTAHPIIRAAILDPEGPAFFYNISIIKPVCGFQKCLFKILDIIAQCVLQPYYFIHNAVWEVIERYCWSEEWTDREKLNEVESGYPSLNKTSNLV